METRHFKLQKKKKHDIVQKRTETKLHGTTNFPWNKLFMLILNPFKATLWN